MPTAERERGETGGGGNRAASGEREFERGEAGNWRRNSPDGLRQHVAVVIAARRLHCSAQ